jgi:hypothetical protein
MVLHPEAAENFHPPIVQADGHGYGQGALGVFQAVAVVEVDFQEIGHAVKLGAGHVESRVAVDVHL